VPRVCTRVCAHQPCCLASVNLSVPSADMCVRLEAIAPGTGDVLARTFGRGAATFIALPTPPPFNPEDDPAPPGPAGGTAAAGGGAKGGAAAKGAKAAAAPAVVSPEDAAATFAVEAHRIRSGLRTDASMILQV
jgi:hypothetical protein